MHAFRCVLVLLLGLLASGSSSPLAPPESTGPAQELTGLWEAKRRFGPDIRGSLRIRASANGWRAEIAGRSTVAKVTGDAIAFELPDGNGEFRGRFAASRTVSSRRRLSIVASNSTPKSMRHAISSTPAAFSCAAMARHFSGVPIKLAASM